MKLLFCKRCHDIRKIHFKKTTCRCGKVWGKYLPDCLNSVFSEDAIILGIDNFSLNDALSRRSEKPKDNRIEAFLIPKTSPAITIEKKVIKS